jgi:hypothetical protein
LGWREEKEGRGVEHRKEETTERIEEQRGLYTEVKRRLSVTRSGEAKLKKVMHWQRFYNFKYSTPPHPTAWCSMATHSMRALASGC